MTLVLLAISAALPAAAPVVSNSFASVTPGSWSGIFGSGQGSGESGRAVVRTTGGGYAIAGNSEGFSGGEPAFWLLKLDGTGDVEWQRLYRFGPGPKVVRALAEAADGGLVMAGDVGNGSSIWVMKVDAVGDVAWSNLYTTNDPGLGGSFNQAYGLVRTSDDGFALAGRVAGYFGLAKLDAGGALQWIRAYPAGAAAGAEQTYAASLVETPDGGLAVSGTWLAAGICRVLRTGASGDVQWEETVGSDQRIPFGITNGNGGGFLLTGTVAAAPWVIALGDEGAVTWENTYSSLGATAIAPAPGGGYAIASSSSQAALIAIDSNGAPTWARAFADLPSSVSTFHALVATLDGGFLAVGEDAVGMDTRLLAVKVDTGGGFVGCLDEEFSVPIRAMPTSLTSAPLPDAPVDESSNTTVAAQAVTAATTDAAERIVCRATLPMELGPAALAVDPAGNGVAEPGEQFSTEPSWTNFGPVATSLSGHTSGVSDSNGLDTAAPDPDAAYGTIAPLATSDCAAATGDCFRFQFHEVPRPSQHWDTYADETLTTSDPHHQYAKRWVIHVGLSFDDVAPASGFYPYIENIFHNGITTGCGGPNYCPATSTTRAQMAVFLLKSKFGSAHQPPPASGTVFNDVPADAPFAAWIEELASLGITGGCGGGDYCPNDAVTRRQMSAFLLKTLDGEGYVPPPAAGIFGDVPQTDTFAPWIEDLYNRQITAGCSASPLLYCPDGFDTRQQMAVFLVKTFSLALYGP